LEIQRGIKSLSRGQRKSFNAARHLGGGGPHRCRKRVERLRAPSGRRLPQIVEIAARRMRDGYDRTAEVDDLGDRSVKPQQDLPETGIVVGTVEDGLEVIEPL
jgi:hypothetical protein